MTNDRWLYSRKHVSYQASLQSLGPSSSGKRSALAFETSVRPDGPRNLPACLHQPLLNCGSKYAALIGMACSCYSEGGSSARRPLMSTSESKADRPFPSLSVFHLDLSIGQRRGADKRADLHGACREDCSKALHWGLF